MGGLFSKPKFDTSATDKQMEELAKQEREQAAQLAARRRAAYGRSKTLFDQIAGIDDTLSTALGGGTPNTGSSGGGFLSGYTFDFIGSNQAAKTKQPVRTAVMDPNIGRGYR